MLKFGPIVRDKAPFVLTPEMAYVMGGRDSPIFKRFISLCCRAYNIIRTHANLFVALFAMVPFSPFVFAFLPSFLSLFPFLSSFRSLFFSLHSLFPFCAFLFSFSFRFSFTSLFPFPFPLFAFPSLFFLFIPFVLFRFPFLVLVLKDLRRFSQMISSGIPQLNRKTDLDYLSKALVVALDEDEAAKRYTALIHKSLDTKMSQINFAVHILAHRDWGPRPLADALSDTRIICTEPGSFFAVQVEGFLLPSSKGALRKGEGKARPACTILLWYPLSCKTCHSTLCNNILFSNSTLACLPRISSRRMKAAAEKRQLRNIVTSFLEHQGQILLLKRSSLVRTFPGNYPSLVHTKNNQSILLSR